MRSLYTAALVPLLMGSMAEASIPRQNPQNIEAILQKSGTAKYNELRSLGARAYFDLKVIAFTEAKDMKVRWRALMAMARLGERQSLPEMKQALKSKQWFMRDAALKVLPAIDSGEGAKAALGALDDSALVVRTTAVDSLHKLRKSEVSPKLWSMLYNKENYMKKQSLWIRRHIVEALADIAPKGSEAQFIKVFDDADSTLYEPAIKGLERLTGKRFGDKDEPANYRRYRWQKWWASRSS